MCKDIYISALEDSAQGEQARGQKQDISRFPFAGQKKKKKRAADFRARLHIPGSLDFAWEEIGTVAMAVELISRSLSFYLL